MAGFDTPQPGASHYVVTPNPAGQAWKLFDANTPWRDAPEINAWVEGVLAKKVSRASRGMPKAEALKQQQHLLRAMLDDSPDTVEELIASANFHAERLGLRPADVTRHIHDPIREVLESKGFNGYEWINFDKDVPRGERVFWRPDRDVIHKPTPIGGAAVQTPPAGYIPPRAGQKVSKKRQRAEAAEAAAAEKKAARAMGMGGKAVPEGRALVPVGEQGLATTPPGNVPPGRAMTPARPSGQAGKAVMAAPPAGVGPPRAIDRAEIAVDGKWSEAELERRAIEYASLQVAKFMPSFMLNSRLTQVARGIIPFAGFSHEAVRVWKNTMVEKPHLAAFWSHFTDMVGQFSGAAAGFTPEEIQTARANLPYYQEGKKMLMWPGAVNGKPTFIDMSYLIPLANVVEVERDEQTLFGKVASLMGVNVTSNPVVASFVAASTGRDAFRNQPLEPRFTERQLGVTPEGYKMRSMVGLAEHVAATFLPPIIPPGYVGNNLLEMARGQVHPKTGQELEDGLYRTLATNLLGVRLHEADANAALLNIGHQERLMNERITEHWDRWAWAVANGRNDDAERAEKNLYELRLQRGDTPEEAMKYLADGVAKREPGKYRNYPNKDLRAALKSLRATGVGKSPKDAAAMAEMLAASRNKRRGWRAMLETEDDE